MSRQIWVVFLSVVGLVVHGFTGSAWPLWLVVGLGGAPMLWDLARKAVRGEFGADLLAGISILTCIALEQYLAGAIVVLMLSGGEALEQFAVGRASSVLEALARRLPSVAQRKSAEGWEEIRLDEITTGDLLVVLPHQTIPVDGVVVEGHGRVNEAYLTGEPYECSKIPGSAVLSGSLNGETSLLVRAEKLTADSRYARIMRVMEDSQQHRPQMRRLGDQLGAWYTPLGLAVALLAWGLSGEPERFLSVLVIATPCPLLIAIPVAIIGSISLAARRGILVRDAAVLERVGTCKTIVLDKTGTLTYGRPVLTGVKLLDGFAEREVLGWAGSLARYSRHPLSLALQEAAGPTEDASEISEPPGSGVTGLVGGRRLALVGRKHLTEEQQALLGASESGMESILLVEGAPAARFSFRDQPRKDTAAFLGHLHGRHGFERLMIVSGDRQQEVDYLAGSVGLTELQGVACEVYGGRSPEEKLALVSELQGTLFVGDGVNDAPALAAATVGLAMGQSQEIVTEAAGAVVLDSSLRKVDEFLHIGRRLRRVALQSALGGIGLSLLGMGLAAVGLLTPVQGAIGQELIDLVAVLNALRTTMPGGDLSDYA